MRNVLSTYRPFLMFVLLALLARAAMADAPTAILTPDAPVIRLDEIGLYAVGYRYRNGPERRMPDGWSGMFEERTGIAIQAAGVQNGREAFLIHCPWRGGTGVTFQEFAFRLPRGPHILLRGATAMRDDIVGKSDGATFRVYVNGRERLDIHRTDAAWQPFSFDLTPLAGRTVVVRFETDPGPKDNPSFDYSLWAGRELVLEGFRPVVHVPPDPPRLRLARLNAPARSAVPPSGFAGRSSVRIAGDRAVLRYQGEDGEMEYTWRRPTAGEDSLLGHLSLRAKMHGDSPVEVPLARASTVEWTETASLMDTRWEDRPGGPVLVRTFRVGSAVASVRINGHLEGKSLVLEVDGDQPLVKTFDGGAWGPVFRRRKITVPYYSGSIYYLPAQNLFVNAFLDWTHSSASLQEQTRAGYGARTNGTRQRLHERVIYAAAWHLAEMLPGIPNVPSPFMRQVGSRIVLDSWGGSFTDNARQFETLADYGIRDCIALIHVWQRSGYDNALPAHVPANAGQGGDDGMKTLVSTGKRLGYLVALHENYVDYYPNYEGFQEDEIALDSQGKRVPAWYNPGTKIQSFAVKPNSILPLARAQSAEIHRRYGTNADYLDVHSAVPPWFHVDFRAGEEGAGGFRRVWDAHRELWQFERATHSGPVFGEGANHWYWSGCLDGVEAQFGAGWPGSQGMTAPLMVDFDLLRIHPLQSNHGMGYYERWWSHAGWGTVPPMIVLDQYRMQEVAYGHAGFLGAPTWGMLPLAWLEHHLLTPVTARCATARPVEINYEMDGRWVDSTAAAKAGRWPRVQVRYDNGLTITANASAEPLRAGDLTLPQFGWVARGAGVTAWTALRDGIVSDYAETKDSVFANARNAAHWNVTGVRRIRPVVAEFTQTGPRAFRARYRWTVGERLDHDARCFVHFVAPSGDMDSEAIRFQQDHALPQPASRWTPDTKLDDGPYTIRVPDCVPDGDYAWTIGLYTQGSGRVTLEGADDGHGRIRLGTLRVTDGGKTIIYVQEKDIGEARRGRYSAHLNEAGQIVDFGAVRTNGSVRVRREGGEWVLQTFPRAEPFVLELSAAKFGPPTQVKCVGGTVSSVHPTPVGGRWRLNLNGAREYRWTAAGATRK